MFKTVRVSAQEAIYRVCSLHFKQCSRGVTYIPTGSKPLRMSLPMSVITAKRDEDENIWMTSILEEYYARPENETFNFMCLADFCSGFTFLPVSSKPMSTFKKTLPIYELQHLSGYIKQRYSGR